MGPRRRTALRAPGPPNREARGRSSGVKRTGRVSEVHSLDQGGLQIVGRDLSPHLLPSPSWPVAFRRATGAPEGWVGVSPHFQDALHALLAVAFEKKQLLVTVDREGARHRWSERDLHGLPGGDLLPDCKGRLGIINEEIVRHQDGHALDGKFDRLTGTHDEMARAELIAVGFDHGPLDAVRVQRNFEGKWLRGRARDDWHEDEQTDPDCKNVQHCPALLPDNMTFFPPPSVKTTVTSKQFRTLQYSLPLTLSWQFCFGTNIAFYVNDEPAPNHNSTGGLYGSTCAHPLRSASLRCPIGPG